MTSIYAQIFHGQMELMKDMLERGEMIYRDRNTPGYRRFKQETMAAHYRSIDAFWTLMQQGGFVEKCECPGREAKAMARRWSDCELCGGSGFKAASVTEEEVPDGATPVDLQ